jgi:hypothetical protein
MSFPLFLGYTCLSINYCLWVVLFFCVCVFGGGVVWFFCLCFGLCLNIAHRFTCDINTRYQR